MRVGLADVGTCDGAAVVGAVDGVTVGMHMLHKLPSGQYSQLLQYTISCLAPMGHIPLEGLTVIDGILEGFRDGF